MTGRYRALLIGNGIFESDPSRLANLNGPASDVAAIRAALINPSISLFEECDVASLVDATDGEIRRAIDLFYARASRDDVLLLYYSGHGELDKLRNLYFCARNTEIDLLASTAIAHTSIVQMMQNSVTRRLVVLLDCCNSGRFKAGASDLPPDLAGSGRYIIASSRATELSRDAERPGQLSPFTHFLVESFVSGAADSNNDGYVSVSEVFDFVRRGLAKDFRQVAVRHLDGAIGDLALVRSRPVEVLGREPGGLSISTAPAFDGVPTGAMQSTSDSRVGAPDREHIKAPGEQLGAPTTGRRVVLKRLSLGAAAAVVGGGTWGWLSTRDDSQSLKRQHPNSSYEHFSSLRDWKELNAAGEGLHAHLGDAYAEVWCQRFQGGVILHPSRIEDWGHPPRAISHSIWCLLSDGHWFAQLRPPVEPISESAVLRSLFQSQDLRASAEARLSGARWTAHFPPLEAGALNGLFRPHCENQGAVVSGGIAHAYVLYDLHRFLGRPLERNVVLVSMFRFYADGFCVGPVFDPASEQPLAAGATCSVEAGRVDSAYVLTSEFSSHSTDKTAVDGAAGGYSWEWGTWKPLKMIPPRAEQLTRPPRGFFLD